MLARSEAAARRFTADMTAHAIRKQYKVALLVAQNCCTQQPSQQQNCGGQSMWSVCRQDR